MVADDGSMKPVEHDNSEDDKQLAQELKDMEADPLVHPVATRDDNSKPTIAVVEDDDEIASYLQTELSNEYNVCYYPNGKVALAAILKDMPDLVISDVMMPEMDGITLCTKLKSNSSSLLKAETRIAWRGWRPVPTLTWSNPSTWISCDAPSPTSSPCDVR